VLRARKLRPAGVYRANLRRFIRERLNETGQERHALGELEQARRSDP